MGYSFNVFSGTLDQVGSSGAVVFEGEVETFADLPEAIGDPAVGSSYLVRTSTGVWLVNRRQAGIWIRKNNTGVRATDWEYGGDYPVNSVNGQSGNIVLGASDVGAAAASHTHAASAVTSGVFDNARINFAAPSAIGSTTAAAITGTTGTFSTLAANNGTLNASAPVLDLAQTWNNSGVTFTALRINATNTLSATNSRLLELQVDGTRRLSFDVSTIQPGNLVNSVSLNNAYSDFYIVCNGVQTLRANISFISSLSGTFSFAGNVLLTFDAVDALAQRRTTNPQTFRLYNTYTDASNYERGFMRWSSNVLQIGTEKAGTGSARALEFQTDGTTRLIISTGGLIQIGGASSAHVALKRNSNTLQIRSADDLTWGGLLCGALTLNGNLDASTRNIVTDTTTGTRIGTGTTQKIGFFNATPVVQQAAIADATDAATTQARLNDLLATMRTFGLIAT